MHFTEHTEIYIFPNILYDFFFNNPKNPHRNRKHHENIVCNSRVNKPVMKGWILSVNYKLHLIMTKYYASQYKVKKPY